jgi:hypothetical protein
MQKSVALTSMPLRNMPLTKHVSEKGNANEKHAIDMLPTAKHANDNHAIEKHSIVNHAI